MQTFDAELLVIVAGNDALVIGKRPSMSLEVSVRPSMANLIFEPDSEIMTSPSAASTSLVSSSTVLRGTMMPAWNWHLQALDIAYLRQTMTVGGNGAKQRFRARGHFMQIDAVQVIAGFFRGDGEAGLLDQRLQLARSANSWVMSPDARSGKSWGGRDWREKRERPAKTRRRPSSGPCSISSWAPSGNLRTMS